MAKSDQNRYRLVCFIVSVVLNIFLMVNLCISRKPLSWSAGAAAEAEAVASISCSGHGRAFLDGFIENGTPVCECNACYGGLDCSQLLPNCVADADRMSYDYSDNSYISQELEKNIRKLHAIVGNAVTDGRYIVFGAGSTQLLNAAVYALSMNMSSPAKVVAEKPFYPVYKEQTEFFKAKQFEFHGDASLLRNGTSNTNENVIEFVASPNNPDGNLKKAVLEEGPYVKTIHDYAYYWPHYTAIPAPADEDVMIFTMSKLTGHAGSRFGWGIVKDKNVYENMLKYKSLADSGTSKDTQLRALKLIKVVLEDGGRGIFNFAYRTMSGRWTKLKHVLSLSKRFKLQEIPLLFCNYSRTVKGASPAFAWLKCMKEEDSNCYEVLHHEANILGRKGSSFNAENRYVRLSLVKSADDFNLLMDRFKELVSKEEQIQTTQSSEL
ncbi:Tryptophan aminotransferase-related protein 4 [Sesamum alatum]|uniref:Tryptophan aminotransferase-related protein 4 n=1 Tax=Sesamum alatum TaxID=300844 RepID=A0AAE2CN69_9LAMI|nr:Tryptophan aminotransferase-related protein 4 [Sesamum alatum]